MQQPPKHSEPDTGPAPQAQPLLLPGLSVEVFAETSGTNQVVRRAQRNRAFTRMDWRFRPGGLPGALEEFGNRPSPDLLIIETDAPRDILLSQLEALSQDCADHTRVLVIGAGDDNEVGLFRSLLKLGVSDYLAAPVTGPQIIGAITDLYRESADVKLGKVTAFLGAGGGTGSSTIAQNVAVAMSRLMGTDVLLADLDPQFGTVGLNFDVEDSYAITDVLRRGSPVDEVLIERITCKVSPTLGLLTVEPSVDNRPEMPIQAVIAILELADHMPRHVVLDMTHVWSLRTKKTLCRADNIVLTTMPTLGGLRNARNLVDVLRRIRATDDPPVLVLNKTGLPKRLEISTAEFKDALGLETVFEVPYDARLFSKAQAKGATAIEEDEPCRTSRQIIELARRLNGTLDTGDPRSLTQRVAARLHRWW